MTDVTQQNAQSVNVNYELHTLGWKSFQDLCVVIMREIWGHTVQSFCDSNDGGRDGAFYGSWKVEDKLLSGAFTAQCKFTAEQSKSLKLGDLKDELQKAKRLASKNLCRIYVLFTNAKLTGTSDEQIKDAFEAIEGIDSFLIFGKERISLEIQTSARLRMIVPRIYGIGDLSQILDQRAHEQAMAILSALGDDLNKFVRTTVFHSSAQALIEHGFVLLLGEPACGKSTIAAALAIGAIDQWKCSTIKITSASEFTAHWNPNEPKRLYWVDDAFGATQMDYASVNSWNTVFPQIQAAIKSGTRILFTSRDYIYSSAKSYLKESALPIIKESQVVIKVNEINLEEKEQILYNHIKLGTQSKEFKKNIKPYLKQVVENSFFTPEIARRLGSHVFTKKLNITSNNIICSENVRDFVEKPLDFLLDVISTLDSEYLSALALIFMRDGVLISPVETTTEENKAIEMIGGTQAGLRAALNAMNNSLVILLREDEQYAWRFKHPTIRDAFAQFISENIELMDIYLTGAPMRTIMREVSCGVDGIEGIKIIIPHQKYQLLFDRLEQFNKSNWQNKIIFNGFMSKRCGRKFLENYIQRNHDYIASLKITSSFFIGSDIDVIVTLDNYGLLPKLNRDIFVKQLSDNAVNQFDVVYMRDEVKTFLSDQEFNDIKARVVVELIPNLEEVIVDLRNEYQAEYSSPEAHFDDLRNSINVYMQAFSSDEILDALYTADSLIDQTVDELSDQFQMYEQGNADSLNITEKQSDTFKSERSIFDDVDT